MKKVWRKYWKINKCKCLTTIKKSNSPAFRIMRIIWLQLRKYSSMPTFMFSRQMTKRRSKDLATKSKKRKIWRGLRKSHQSMCKLKQLYISDVKEFLSLVIQNLNCLVKALLSMTMRCLFTLSKTVQILSLRCNSTYLRNPAWKFKIFHQMPGLCWLSLSCLKPSRCHWPNLSCHTEQDISLDL